MNDGKIKVIQTVPYLFDPFIFNVVNGTTRPTNPEPNTIWVKTSTVIKGWTCSPLPPDDMTGEWVWIKTGTKSVSTLQILNQSLVNDSIKCYPLKIGMYQSGAWIYVESEIYNGTKWITPCVYLCDDSHMLMLETDFSYYSYVAAGNAAGYEYPSGTIGLSGNTFTIWCGVYDQSQGAITYPFYTASRILSNTAITNASGRELIIKVRNNLGSYEGSDPGISAGYNTNGKVKTSLTVSEKVPVGDTSIISIPITHDVIYPGIQAYSGQSGSFNREKIVVFDWYII